MGEFRVTSHWLLLISKHEINKMMNCSGKNGIFVTRLSQDITTKPAALWVTKLEGESHEEYLQRTLQEAKGAPLTWRRGDGNDLGYHCSENDITDKSWALWGIPPLNGPGNGRRLAWTTGLDFKNKTPATARERKSLENFWAMQRETERLRLPG